MPLPRCLSGGYKGGPGVAVSVLAIYPEGYRSTNRFFVPFRCDISASFYVFHYVAGRELVHDGVPDTEARTLKMQELKRTALAATPVHVLVVYGWYSKKNAWRPEINGNKKGQVCGKTMGRDHN